MLDQEDNYTNSISVLPFLKWAGGKRWLVNKYAHIFPDTYERYVEPFVGSGAVFFHLQPERSILSDMNADLIQTYQAIKDDWRSVWKILEEYHCMHSEEFYYEIREKSFRSTSKRAARFIYLNRTCWNGLYRVNMRGEFNVPIGTKMDVIRDVDNFSAVSQLLNGASLYSCDFETCIKRAKENDFLFIDPPYTIKHNNNGFIKYNDKLFSWDDQIRLRDSVCSAVDRGVKVLVTNADHSSIRALYKGVGKFISLDRASIISGKSEGRGRYSELLVKCY